MSVADAGSTPSYSRFGSRGVVYFSIVAIVLAWSLSFVSFLDVKTLALWAGAVVLWAVQHVEAKRDTEGFQVFGRCWIALAIAVGTGLLVAPATRQVLDEGFRVAGLLLFASLAWPVIRREERAFLVVLAAAGAGCALLALFQWFGWLPRLFPAFDHYDQRMYSVFGNQGLLGGWLAVSLVLALGLWPAAPRETSAARTAAVLLTTGLLFIVLLMSGSRAALLALSGGVAVLAGCRVFSGRRVLWCAALALPCIAVVVMSSDGAILSRLGGTLGQGDTGGNFRLWVWRACTEMIVSRPWLGAGLGNFSFAAPPFLGSHTPPELADTALRTTYHAHFDALEWLVETGLAGLLLAIWILSRIRIRASLSFAAGVSLAIFSCFHPAWYSTPHALAGLLFLGFNLPQPARAAARPGWHALAGVAAFAGCFAFVVLVLYPSYLLRRAEDLHLAGQPAASAYERAAGAWGSGAEARESHGIYLLESGEPEAARDAFLRAREGINTGRMYQLLGMAAASAGRREEACAWYRECLERWPHASAVRAQIAIHCAPELLR